MSKLQRLKNFALSLNTMKKELGISRFLKIARANLEFKILKKPEGKRILVLSPHPDDDVLGAGGTLALYPKKSEITVLYFGDGTSGTKKGKRKESLKGIRRKEAQKAGKILGVSKQIFLDLPDGEFVVEKNILAKVLYYIKRANPSLCYLPFFLDPNPDHQEVCKFLLSTCQRWKKEVKLYSYEIWNPILPNRLIGIGKVISKKRLALRAHQSQSSSRNYEKAILGLNQYRGEITGTGSFAEAFFATNKEIWLDLIQRCGMG